MSPTHIKEVKRYAETYYKPFFKDLSAKQIRTHHIEDFYLQLPDHLSEKTKWNIMVMLKNFTIWLIDMEVLSRRPKFRKITLPEHPIQWITKEDQLKVLLNIHPHHKPIFNFLFHHPVRTGEARALKVKDFDLQNMQVSIERAWSLKEIRSTKTKKAYYLPISKHFDITVLKDKLPEAFVFLNKAGRPYTSEGLRKLWHRAREKAEVPHIKLYNASKHSICSQASNAGVDLAIISKACNHSSLEMTKKYTKMNTELLRSVVDGVQDDGTQVVQISKKQKI
jgi:integrase